MKKSAKREDRVNLSPTSIFFLFFFGAEKRASDGGVMALGFA
jgi:hypothetical protein